MNEIVCGNIGSVYLGNDAEIAQEKYDEYVNQSKTNYGRAAGEDVYWIKNGEIYKEFVGSLAQSMQDNGNPLD